MKQIAWALAAMAMLALASVATTAVAAGTPARAGASYAGHTKQKYFADVTVARSGRSIARFQSVWDSTCQTPAGAKPGPSTWSEVTVLTNIPVSSTGTFQKTVVSSRGESDGVTLNFTTTLNGAFRDAYTAAGTLQAQMTAKKADGTVVGTCDSGPVSWSASDILGYAGVTSQQLPVAASFSPGVKKLVKLDVEWRAACQHNADYKTGTHYNFAFNDPIRNGGFVDNGHLSTDLGGGYTGYQTIHTDGHFVNAKVVKGTFRLSMTVKDAKGTVADQCDTGPVTWTVRD